MKLDLVSLVPEHHSIIVFMAYTVRLSASNEPIGTDHTGEIIQFSHVGTGEGTDPPRPWLCYTLVAANSTGVEWKFPDGTTVPALGEIATGDQLSVRPSGVHILSRGPTHYSPDGEHCCVVTADLTQRRCVTFSEWL